MIDELHPKRTMTGQERAISNEGAACRGGGGGGQTGGLYASLKMDRLTLAKLKAEGAGAFTTGKSRRGRLRAAHSVGGFRA